jgi:parallel beta-helix repeat protein
MATVSGFEAGVVIDGGSANTVQNLIVRDNVGLDDPFNAELGDGIILFESASNLIVDNVIKNNGIFDGVGVLGGAADGNTIHRNIVEGTVGPAPPPPRPGSSPPFVGGPAGQGIIINAAGFGENVGQTITGSIVRDNVVRGNASAGIANVNVIDSEVVGNAVGRNGLRNSRGNGIGLQLAPTAIAGSSNVLIQGNEVHGNGAHGIVIEGRATENRIIDNDAADNNVLGSAFRRFFDLFDGNPACDSNVWSGNVWGSGLYSPVCVTNNGTGPPAPTGPETFDDPSCSDGFDNDEDGLADGDDPDCVPPPFENSNVPRTCTNGLDDDGDGLVDLDDPGCEPEGVPGEPACSDGIDNDGDGLVDLDDPDCRDSGVPPAPPPEASEGPPGSPTCSDGIDNDRDRLIDGDDPDCQ